MPHSHTQSQCLIRYSKGEKKKDIIREQYNNIKREAKLIKKESRNTIRVKLKGQRK